MKTSLLLSHVPTPAGFAIRALLKIEGAAPSQTERAPLNISLVLDRSGSMAGDSLTAVKKAAQDLIRRLDAGDRISVVTFDDDVEALAPPQASSDHSALIQAVGQIQPRGCTNLSGGWLMGRHLLSGGQDEYDINRLILLSDGHANQGLTDEDGLAGLASKAAEAGVSTTTIGVGRGYDENLMLRMAEAGMGTGYFMEELDQATGIFEEELLGLLSLSAQNLRVTLLPNPWVLATAVLHSYPATENEDGSLELNLADLYAREPREVLMEFELDAFKEDEPTQVAELRVEADVITEAGGMEHRSVSLPIHFDPTTGAVANPEVEKSYVLLQAARARREAVRRGDEGDFGGALHALRSAHAELALMEHDDPELAREINDLNDTATVMEQKQAYASEDRKYLRHMADLGGKGKRGAMRRGRRGPSVDPNSDAS